MGYSVSHTQYSSHIGIKFCHVVHTGQPHQIASGHTISVTCLQFDETIITGSLDKLLYVTIILQYLTNGLLLSAFGIFAVVEYSKPSSMIILVITYIFFTLFFSFSLPFPPLYPTSSPSFFISQAHKPQQDTRNMIVLQMA